MARPQSITDDTIIEALAAGEVTAAEVAARLGIGQSTAAKRLAALDATGSVRRDPGGRVNGVRVADRWSAADVLGGDGNPGGPEDERGPGPDSTPTGPAGTGAETGGGERLGRGALGALVREYLAGNPGKDLGPAQVGKALGRSQGAVSNALARLEAAGEARLVSASPRRYRIAAKR